MNMVAEMIGAVLLVGGTVFCVIGVYGMVRLPDTYNRLHATGKVMTFGAASVIFSLVFLAGPRFSLKAFAVTGLLLLTVPVVSHALARAAYRVGEPLAPETVRDDLAEDRPRLTDGERKRPRSETPDAPGRAG